VRTARLAMGALVEAPPVFAPAGLGPREANEPEFSGPVLKHLFIRWPSHVSEQLSREVWEHHKSDADWGVAEKEQEQAYLSSEPPTSQTALSDHTADTDRASAAQAVTARDLVDAILKAQRQAPASGKQQPLAETEQKLRETLALHEAGTLSKEHFLAEVRRVADRNALRRAVLTMAVASVDAGTKHELLKKRSSAEAGLQAPSHPPSLRREGGAKASVAAPAESRLLLPWREYHVVTVGSLMMYGPPSLYLGSAVMAFKTLQALRL